jgi:hypothetical protein
MYAASSGIFNLLLFSLCALISKMSIIIQKLITKKEKVFLLKKLRIRLNIFDFEINKILRLIFEKSIINYSLNLSIIIAVWCGPPTEYTAI